MTEDFNDDQKKESLSLKNLVLKILFFLVVLVVSYNLFLLCYSYIVLNLLYDNSYERTLFKKNTYNK